MKKVGIIMGSDSDLPILRKAMDTLESLGIPYECHIYSAHRTPEEARQFALNARANGFGAIIAAAGMAAHLAGAVAANTTLPVIGIPCKSTCLDGIEALLSTVMMPSGIPVNWFWPLTWEKAAENASIRALAQANPGCFFETVPEAGLNADSQTLNEQYNSADEYIGKYVFAVSLKMIGKRA